MSTSFGVVGGDERQAFLVRMLRERGDTVQPYGLESWGVESGSLEQAMSQRIVLLPMPLCRADGCLNCQNRMLPAAEVLSMAGADQLLLAGGVPQAERKLAHRMQLTLQDYLEREELAVANAIPTAEGAIRIAMEQLPVTLCGTQVLVLGFGRIGKRLTGDLLALGAKVTVGARKAADRTWAASLGCRKWDFGTFPGNPGELRAVFNTIPAQRLGRCELQGLRKDCVCIELASCPGIDREAAEALGLRLIRASGLPGKTAPETAALALLETADHMIVEWRRQA